MHSFWASHIIKKEKKVDDKGSGSEANHVALDKSD